MSQGGIITTTAEVHCLGGEDTCGIGGKTSGTLHGIRELVHQNRVSPSYIRPYEARDLDSPGGPWHRSSPAARGYAGTTSSRWVAENYVNEVGCGEYAFVSGGQPRDFSCTGTYGAPAPPSTPLHPSAKPIQSTPSKRARRASKSRTPTYDLEKCQRFETSDLPPQQGIQVSEQTCISNLHPYSKSKATSCTRCCTRSR